MNAREECPVRVAVRIRPQLERERDDLCRLCVSSVPGEPQVLLGDDSVFTKCVQDLVERCFEGLNATVLAYGQTGSGKTYTMGTGLDNSCDTEQGIIPRAVDQLYNSMEKRINEARSDDQAPPSFSLEAQFIEIYNDEVIDLLDAQQGEEKKRISIHEDKEGNIHLRNVTTALVTTRKEALQILRIGALNRTTGYTLMNEQSSRSHAMFTLKLTIKRQNGLRDAREDLYSNSEFACSDSTLFAKLNFVDLAGSERVKRTGATGQRAKEGISINSGLLALGNVISALGDRSLKVTHVPYRDSKLTRLLQDSLGGNSRTLMIACVGPSDCDFIETLNTLKYANRARNIRNRVVVNQSRSSVLVSDLQLRLRQLEQELTEFRLGQRSADDFAYENQLYEENLLLANEVKSLNVKVRLLQDMVKTLKNGDAIAVSQEETNTTRRRTVELEGEVFSGTDYPSSTETQNREYIIESMADLSEAADLYRQRDSMTSSASDSSHPQLTELQNEIVEREREIRRLKASHERLLNAKITYEARLEELSNKIRKTEMERDQAMSLIKKNYGAKEENGEREQALKREYEQKLGAMRAELRHLGSLKKENEKLLKEQSKNLTRIAALQSRLDEVKHAKRDLVQQMKANAQEVLATERRRAKQIRSLQRESLKKDMCIQSLRTEKERAAAILRQKQQEVSALRRRSRSALDLNRQKVANAVGGRDQDVLWRQVRTQLHECIAKREANIEVECDYDQLLEKRKSINKTLTELKEKQRLYKANNFVAYHCDRTEDEIDCLETNLTYVEKRIRNCEQRIVDADEVCRKDNAVESKLYALFDSCQSMRKAKTLMKKLSSVTLLQAQVAASRRRKMDILDAKVQQLKKEKKILEQLLVHVVKDSSQSFPESQAILKALSNHASTESDASESQQSQTSKARQRMTTAAQLLYPENRVEAVLERPRNDCQTRDCSPEAECSFDLFNSDECYATNDIVIDGSWEETPINNEYLTKKVGWSLSRLGSVKPDVSPVRKVHADGSSFLSLSHSGRLMLWDAETLTGFHIPSSDLTDPRDAKLNLHMNQLYVASRFGIAVRDTRTWQSAYVLSTINRMTVSEPSPQIPFVQVDSVPALPYVFGTTSKSLHVWDIRSLKEIANLCMAKCCFEDDSTKVYVVSSQRYGGTAILAGSQFIQLLQLDTSKDCVSLNQSLELHYPTAGCVRALSAVESLIFAVVNDSLLYWDTSSNEHNAHQISHCYESAVSCMEPFQASSKGEHCWLISADECGNVHSWDPAAPTAAQMGHLQAHCDCINSLSSACQLLFTASSDSTVALWKQTSE